jgi:hypothetical protein
MRRSCISGKSMKTSSNKGAPMANDIEIVPNVELVQATGVLALLEKIRPQWQSKSLIDRVRRLLDVDPSSACQRLLNAAIHDLREKVVIAGVDIATEAAAQYKLPPISKGEDVEDYSASRLIELAYRMGLLTRPEWRRVCRCYEIRRDLEHEDDEYEAGVEDCVYIFNTCIEVVLSVDPVHLIRVVDVKELVEQGGSVVPDEALILDFGRAPQPRQEEILKFLISAATDREQTDIVQQNAFGCLKYIQPHTQSPVLVRVGAHLQDRVGRTGLDLRNARVAYVAGILPYLRQSARRAFFAGILDQMIDVGIHWTAHQHHGDLLRSFIEVGAFNSCPEEVRKEILKWLVQTYIGEQGGKTRFGNVRHVFYSNSAAPLIRDIINTNAQFVRGDLKALAIDKDIKSALFNPHIARRFEALVDMVEDG